MRQESEIRTDELKRENRRLRETIRELAYEIEASKRDDDIEPTTKRAREMTKQSKSEDSISPPWDREGYKDKQEWLADRE